jgi:hypothetical protein
VTFTSRTQRPLHPPKPAPADFSFIFPFYFHFYSRNAFSVYYYVVCASAHFTQVPPPPLFFPDNNNNPVAPFDDVAIWRPFSNFVGGFPGNALKKKNQKLLEEAFFPEMS